jgi:hypothetical protein
MKTITDGLKALTVEGEQTEVLAVLNGKETIMPKLKKELPQKNYKLVNDEPVCIGYLEMYTIVSDFFDSLGRNRKGSTFGLMGLEELGINPAECEVI